MRLLIFSLFAVLFALSVIAPIDESLLDWNNPESVQNFWTNLGLVSTVSATDFVDVINTHPEILSFDTVLTSLDTRISENVQIINDNDWLFEAWAEKKGVFIESGAQIISFKDGYIKTKGKGSTTFDPKILPGATILADGSLELSNKQRIVNGEGISIDPLDPQNLILSSGSLVTDKGIISVSEGKGHIIFDKEGNNKILLTGKVELNFEGRGEYVLSGKKNELFTVDLNAGVIESKLLVIVKNIKNPKHSFILDKGKVEIQTSHRFKFDKKSKFRWEDILPSKNKVQVKEPTYLCFGECFGMEKINPDEYKESAIEVIANRERLKVTLRNNNKIDIEMAHPQYDSIFVDSKGGIAKITQYAFDEKDGHPVFRYYSEATISYGEMTGFRSKVIKGITPPLGGVPLFVLDKSAVFDKEGSTFGDIPEDEFVEGNVVVRLYDPKNFQKSYIHFELDQYHKGDDFNSLGEETMRSLLGESALEIEKQNQPMTDSQNKLLQSRLQDFMEKMGCTSPTEECEKISGAIKLLKEGNPNDIMERFDVLSNVGSDFFSLGATGERVRALESEEVLDFPELFLGKTWTSKEKKLMMIRRMIFYREKHGLPTFSLEEQLLTREEENLIRRKSNYEMNYLSILKGPKDEETDDGDDLWEDEE